MRTRTLLAFVLGVAAIATVAAACSGGSGLTGKTWQLTAITEKVPAFQGVVPAADQANYTIEFKSDGTFSAKADCNQLSGTYTTSGSNGLTIVLGPMTLAACPPESLSSQYVEALGKAASYAVASGQLTITLTDEGTLVFK
jgi:heat shock protein HslJ